MKRVRQTRRTDCLSACLASLLELPIGQVPHFYAKYKSTEAFHGGAQKWLARNYGLTFVTITRPLSVTLPELFAPWSIPGRFLASIPAIIGGGVHCVVVALRAGGVRVVWNPEGEDAQPLNVKNAVAFSFLVPLFKKGVPCRPLKG